MLRLVIAIASVLLLLQSGCSSWEVTRGYYKGYTDRDLQILCRDFDVQYTGAYPGHITLDPNEPYDDARLKKALPYMKRSGVTDLDMSRHPFTDAAIPLILQLTDLERLNLSHTEINCSELTALRSLAHLKILYIGPCASATDLHQLKTAISKVHITVLVDP